MKTRYPSADEYAAPKPRYPDLEAVDIRARQATIRDPYRNEVLSNVNDDCMRLAVFEGEYRWHRHPDSDELFLVVEGKLLVDLAGHATIELGAWQYAVVPADTVHRTRTIGRTVNLTFEKRGAQTVFVEPPPDALFPGRMPPASQPDPRAGRHDDGFHFLPHKAKAGGVSC